MVKEMTEDEVLKYWQKEKIYEKVKQKGKRGKKFYFMDGPPYASGHIHMGTALNKILKDIAMRMKRMQGFDVFDRPGYDTHGVPIEFQVEKEIGSGGKQDIEKYGVSKFVLKCKDYATKFIDVMNKEFANLGVWMDWNNPYLTLEDKYIEAIWGAFKKAEEKGLLYLDKYSVHVCPRCETAVAYNEIVYAKQKDTSVYVKFPVKDKKNTYLVIWTTTPWTLPGNTGIMVNPDVEYEEVETLGGERWIIASALTGNLFSKWEMGFTSKKKFPGKMMDGWKYENPIAKNLNLNVKSGYKVVLSRRYVTTEEGTGLVHTAPGHGREDYEVGKEYGLDAPSPVASNGILTSESGKYAGKKAREVDAEIIEDLEEDGFLVSREEYEHDYPLCWRDKNPLLMISQPQWFFKISGIQKKLLAENEKVGWKPEWMKLRMKAWLEGIGDWPVSRQRYWGTPLPIWVNGDDKIVIGSVDELRKLSGYKDIELHKPGIDKIVIRKNGKEYKRVPEVLDVWFDSGVSSWAALSEKEREKFWPADLNIEGKDQVRGWWNSQLILSEITFGKKPFDHILVHGMVLDIGKKKMSKSLGNIVAPEDVIRKYGRDYLRYYFAKISKGEDFAFDDREMSEIKKVFMILSNVNNFVSGLEIRKGRKEVEDKWIISRFFSTVKEVIESYNRYKFPEAVATMEKFLVVDLSRTYIQIVRDRAEEVADLLKEVRTGVLRMFAPVVPFICEKLWMKINEKEKSVHLSGFPDESKKKINLELEKNFGEALMVIEAGLAERDKAGIGLRWPLLSVEVRWKNISELKKLEGVLKKQLNVKKIVFNESKDNKIRLNTRMTSELEAEGYTRELTRKVQSERKKAGMKKGDLIDLKLAVEDDELKKKLEKNILFIKERINARKIDFIDGELSGEKILFSIRDKKIYLKFS